MRIGVNYKSYKALYIGYRFLLDEATFHGSSRAHPVR